MASKTLETWRQIVDERDVDGLDAILSRNVSFHSPVIYPPRRSKAIALKFLTAAFQVFHNGTFRYVREIVTEPHAMLEFTVEIDGLTVNGVDILTWNEEGLIIDFKVMVRPLKAIHLLQERMMEAMKLAIPDRG